MEEQPLDNEFIDILPEAAPEEGIPVENPPTE